jgi:hypothetical protein
MRAHFRPFPVISFADVKLQFASRCARASGSLYNFRLFPGFNLKLKRALKARAEFVADSYIRAQNEERAPETVNSFKKREKEKRRKDKEKKTAFPRLEYCVVVARIFF